MDHEDLLDRAHLVALAHHDLVTAALGADRVRAVWLTGSTMLRDLTVDSDIDTVTLLDGPADADDAPALRSVHAALAESFPGVRYDTTYLDISELAEPPETGRELPQSIDGELILDRPGGEVHPVTWFTLPHAVRVAGDYPGDVEIAADRDAAQTHSHDNLRSYWSDLARRLRHSLAERRAEDLVDTPETLHWVVLGAPRLAMFLDPGASYGGPIPSKSEAGAWVVAQHPEYAELATQVLASRRGETVEFTVGDVLVAADLVEALVPPAPASR